MFRRKGSRAAPSRRRINLRTEQTAVTVTYAGAVLYRTHADFSRTETSHG